MEMIRTWTVLEAIGMEWEKWISERRDRVLDLLDVEERAGKVPKRVLHTKLGTQVGRNALCYLGSKT